MDPQQRLADVIGDEVKRSRVPSCLSPVFDFQAGENEASVEFAEVVLCHHCRRLDSVSPAGRPRPQGA